ncbi:MAG: hypothetical protein LBS49_10500 [Candidatus Accumulibacter sp.]|jgi:hypothetical protein|nr:hypothetical protein [Accumulibacter sp.]
MSPTSLSHDDSTQQVKVFLVQVFLFIVVWSITFFFLRNQRAMMVYPQACAFLITHEIPLVLSAAVRYGICASFLPAFIGAFIRGYRSVKESCMTNILLFMLFVAYASIMEYTFPSISLDYRQWVVMDSVFFAFAVPIGSILGYISAIPFSLLK